MTIVPFVLIGLLLFLFSLWKKLREDYIPSFIFSLGFYILFLLFSTYVLAIEFQPGYVFWFCFLGIAAASSAAIYRFKMRRFEVIEAVVLSSLPLLLSLSIHQYIVTARREWIGIVLFMVGLLALYFFLDMHYKKFTWYKSGRVGFTGLVILGIFFLARAVIALLSPSVLSLVRGDAVISGIIAFLSFLSLFKLSRES